VDQVESEYREEAAYDMEAAGFWPTATRFATAELVQSYKVVSDSPESSVSKLDAAAIEELVAARVDEIESLADALGELANDLPRDEIDPAPFLEHWRLTVTQERQLRRLLRRWNALKETGSPADGLDEVVRRLVDERVRSGSEALDRFEREIDALPVDLSGCH